MSDKPMIDKPIGDDEFKDILDQMIESNKYFLLILKWGRLVLRTLFLLGIITSVVATLLVFKFSNMFGFLYIIQFICIYLTVKYPKIFKKK